MTHIITFDDIEVLLPLTLFISPSRVMPQSGHLLASSDLLADSRRDCLPLKVSNALSKPFPRHRSGRRDTATVVSSRNKHAPDLRKYAGLPAGHVCSMVLQRESYGMAVALKLSSKPHINLYLLMNSGSRLRLKKSHFKSFKSWSRKLMPWMKHSVVKDCSFCFPRLACLLSHCPMEFESEMA